MKATKWTSGLAAAAMLMILPAPGQEREDLPELRDSEVTIPYGELKQLWEAARRGQDLRKAPDPPKPPVTAIIKAATYDLRFDPGAVAIEARYEVTSLTADWQKIPLVGGDPRLVSAESGAAGLLWENGSYHLLTNAIGDHEVVLSLAASRPAGWQDGLRLLPGSATLNRLRVTGLPDGRSVCIPGMQPSLPDDGVPTFHLSGEGGEITMSLERREEIETPVEPAPPTPSTWDIQSEVFVDYHEGRIRYESAVYCQADDGSGLSMDVLVPHNALALKVDGEDLGKNRLGPRQDGLRNLRIDWRTRDILDRRLQVSYEVPQSPLEPDWLLRAPRVAGGGTTRSLFAIAAVDGLELSGDQLRDSIQSRRLPEWLRARIARQDFLTAEAGAELTLRTTWLPRVETAQAMVSTASYASRVVQDGALLVHAEFTIQHQSPITWCVSLPKIEEILSCEINGSAAQPVRRGDDEIEFALAQPAQGTSKVGFCYAARVEAFDPVSGRLELTMPKTGLFIHELTWDLSIPAEYEAEIQGNVVINRQDTESVRPPHVIPLKKELVRGEHPVVEVHYRRRGLDQ